MRATPCFLAFLCTASLAARAQDAGFPPAAEGLIGAPDAEVLLVHVVEKRPFTEAGRWEVSLFAPVQVNGRFTVHAGAAPEIAYHLRENLAAQFGLLFFPVSRQSALAEELLSKGQEAPVAANALLLQYGALAGLEIMPVYGKLDLFGGSVLRLGFYLDAGLGVAKTRIQLASGGATSGRTFGATGVRPLAALGAGFRVFINDRATVRLELRDLVTSAYVSKVNGCGAADAAAISRGEPPASSRCDAASFGDGQARRDNAAIAAQAIGNPSADVMNNLAAYAGVSWLF